jgi:murein DD-endopeptidase MepM/ murein hydrolase activator NlpD
MREGRVKLAGVHACLASRWRRATQPHHPVKPAFTPRAQAPPHHRDLRNPCPSPDPARHPRPSPSPSRAAARVPHDRRLHQDRERFFAFAGADLLLETTADGRVAFAAPFRSYGKLLILDCGAGTDAVLSGFERLDVHPGQSLRQGQPVGAMPGWDPATQGDRPTLYVELRRRGEPVNPAPLMGAS